MTLSGGCNSGWNVGDVPCCVLVDTEHHVVEILDGWPVTDTGDRHIGREKGVHQTLVLNVEARRALVEDGKLRLRDDHSADHERLS